MEALGLADITGTAGTANGTSGVTTITTTQADKQIFGDAAVTVTAATNDTLTLGVDGGTAINVGNPHIIFFVDDIEAFDLPSIGPKIENHQLFPEKCNVTLAKVINKNLIKVN